MAQRNETCQVCGNYQGECNPEAHAAEARAQAYDYYQGYQGDADDDRDYSPDADCDHCGDNGLVDWTDMEVPSSYPGAGVWQTSAGKRYFITVCRECETRLESLPLTDRLPDGLARRA